MVGYWGEEEEDCSAQEIKTSIGIRTGNISRSVSKNKQKLIQKVLLISKRPTLPSLILSPPILCTST
jgi:hypothetical protein